MTRTSWILLCCGGLSLLSGVASCTTEQRKTLGEQCELSSECDTPLVCRLTRCRVECRSSRDCPVGALCAKDGEGLGGCLLPDEATCTLNSECPGVLVCRGGRCGNECNDDRDCAAGTHCSATAEGRLCTDPSSTRCAFDSDCPGDLVCAMDARCRQACFGDRDCREGSVCEGGQCAPLAPSVDGGLDAEPRDGALMDAGADASTDAGLDSSSFDASADSSSDAEVDGAADGATDGAVVVTTCDAAVDCVAPHVAVAACVDGQCVATTCETDWGDCNAGFGDGCEEDLTSSVRHCGACGRWCGMSGTCAMSSCDSVTISVGEDHACELRGGGAVLCQGAATNGALGNGERTGDDGVSSVRLEPRLATGLADAVDIDAGIFRTCALRAGGQVACWGYGRGGAIGDGDFTDRFSPVPVLGITTATQVSVGQLQSCALLSTGAVECWGDNRTGALGDGTSVTSPTPVAVLGITNATQVEAGYTHSCALLADRTIRCWGLNRYGELGDGLTDHGTTCTFATNPDCSLSPVVVGVTDVVQFSTNGQHGCAVVSTGGVHCWGQNRDSQLGVGMTGAELPSSPTPLPVIGITDAVHVSTSVWHTCVIHAGGTVSCWGENGLGEGGVVGPSVVSMPRAVPGVTDADTLALDISVTCANRLEGGPLCWGVNWGNLGPDHLDETFPPSTLTSIFP